jgi:hypothetical protein
MSETEKDYTPYGFLTYAESYGRAASIVAKAIENGARMMWPVPIGTLALHCVELSLKGVVVKEGMTPDEIRLKYGHDLKKLFTATPLDWRDIDVEHIEFNSDAVMSQVLRYRRTDKLHYVVDPEHLLPFTETVFHRRLEHISAGAKRTLCP